MTAGPVPVVLITGASSGIGRAVAHRYAGQGAHLELLARDQGSLADTAAECDGAAGVRTHPADVTDPAALARVVADVMARHGRLDVVVCSAAVMSFGPFTQTDPAVFRRVVETEFFGVVHTAHAVLPIFRSRGTGTLVMIDSLLGGIATPYMSPYVASKWALRGFARVLAIEHRDLPGVRIRTVEPGAVDTPIYRQGANVTGRVPRAPIPVDSADRIARAVLQAARGRRNRVSAGIANHPIEAGFLAAPALYDLLVTPLMNVFSFSRQEADDSTGNVFASRPDANAVSGGWDRQWLRPVALGTAGAAAALAALSVRRAR